MKILKNEIIKQSLNNCFIINSLVALWDAGGPGVPEGTLAMDGIPYFFP